MTQSPNTWSTGAINPINPLPAGGVINGKLYVRGGNSQTYGGTRAELEVYDPTTDSWSSKASMLSPVWGAAAGVMDGKLYVAAGCKANYTFVDTCKCTTPQPTLGRRRRPCDTARVPR